LSNRHCDLLSAGATYFPAQCSAELNQHQTFASARRAKRAGLNFLSFASKAEVERQVLLIVTANCPAIAHRLCASAQTATRRKKMITAAAGTG